MFSCPCGLGFFIICRKSEKNNCIVKMILASFKVFNCFIFSLWNTWYLIGRKSTWIINIFRNKQETPKIIIDAGAASHKNRLIEKIRLSSINWLNRMCCLKVLSWTVKYCHFSDERKLSKLYSLVTCLAMQTFYSLLRAQTQGRTSQNGQEHGNVAPKQLYWYFPQVLAQNGAFPCLQENSIFHPRESHDCIMFLMPQKELKALFRLKPSSERHQERIYQLSPREQTCHQGNSFRGAKAWRYIFIRQELAISRIFNG